MNATSLAADRLEMETLPVRPASLANTGGAQPASLPSPLPSLCLHTILAPFDFSDVSTALLRRLVTLAENSGAVLHILHVVEPLARLVPGEAWQTPVDTPSRVNAAQTQIQQWVAQALPAHVRVATTVRAGRAADEIVAHAQTVRADLIVMSAHVGRGLKNVLLRTTTERVVRQSTCPVLTVPRDQVQNFLQRPEGFPLRAWKRLLLPVDFASRFPDALAYAAAIAIANHATLHLLHGSTTNPAEADETPSHAEDRLAEWLRTELRWPVEHVATIWHKVPLLHAILREVTHSKIDLIVLSPRDCARFCRHRLWSNTDGILRHAPCPVLSVNQNASTFPA